MGISFEEYTRQLRQQQSQAPKPTQNDMRRAINNIQKAAEAGNTASASGVQRKEEEESPFARHLEQIRQAAEQQRAYAEAARKPSAHSASSRNLYSQAQNAATPFGLFGMGDQTLDAEQGRELARQAETRYADQLRREQERLDEEARQARERMAEAQRISQTKEALDRAPQGAQNALGNIYSQAEQRQSSLEGTPYADILRRGDYGRYAQAGESRLGLGAETDRTYDYINDINGFRARADEQAVMMDDAQRLGIYGLMTDDEIGVYNYLYATQGREAAEGYLEELTPELNRQYYSGLKNSTLEDVDDGEAGLSWNEAGASALTALQQPVRSVNSAMANLEDAYRTATGKGIDPYSQLRTTSRLTQDVREGISDDMGEVGQFAYNTAMSALDSTINALVAQGVGEGLGFGGDLASAADVERLKKAVNVLGSLTMSNEVMAMSVAESKGKGYSDVGALSLGFARGAIEYLSEKIGGDWIINKAKGNPTSLLYALKSAMVPEGVEEVMSDAMNEVINNIIDPIYGTEESYIRNAFKHWKDQGAGNGKALAMTLATVIQQEILSFAGGAFAAAGSGTTNYRSNTIAFNDTANRLNTSTEGVVQLMRNIGAEDVFQVAQLAELYGANSAEQLEAKVKEVGDAAAAIDAKMQAQAAEETDQAGEENESGRQVAAPTGNEMTGQRVEDTSSALRAPSPQGEGINENAPAGTAEAVESAAQTGAEGGRIENGNAQIENGNAQIDNGNAKFENGNAQNGAEGVENGADDALVENASKEAEKRNAEPGGNRRITDDDLSRYMRTGKRQHVRNAKQSIVDSGQSPLLRNESEIRDFIRRSVEGEINETTKVYGVVGDNLADDIAETDGNGLDLEGYYLELESNHLNHLSDHIQDTDDRNIPLTSEEIENIPDWIDSYDQVLEVERKGDGSIRVVIGKKINGYSVIVENVSKGRKSLHPRTAWKNQTEVYEKKYGIKKVDESTNPTSGPSAESGQGTGSSNNSILQSDENSNPQNEKAESEEKDSSPAAQNDRGEAARKDSGELETRENTEEAKKDLLEVGEGKVKNNTGEYRMTIRRKRDGHYLASVDRDGRRINAKTFATAAEAAEWAAGSVDGQTQALTDAALDRHKSEKKKGPGITEALFGQVDPEKEARRQKENKAADAATQTLRERIRRLNDQINALKRLEKTTGLTETQKKHKADLQQSMEIMNDELESRKKKHAEKKTSDRVEVKGNKPTQSVADARRTIMDLFHTPEGLRKEAGEAIQRRLDAMLAEGRVDDRSKQQLFYALMDAGMVPKAADPTFRQIREDLSGRRYYVSEQDRKDFGDGWKDLYNRAWGARIFLTNDPTDLKIDAVNREMADAYGENMFPTDAALSDMLDNLIDKAEKGRDGRQKLTEAIEDEAKYTDTEVDEIYEDMFNRLDEQLRTFAKKAGLEVQLKDKAASDMATERKRWEDRMERKAQERRESKIRERVLKGLQRLERLKGKAAPEVRTQIDEVLKDIDTQARSLTPYGIENLQALQKVYEEKAQQEGFVDDDNPGNFIRNPYVEEQLKRLSQKHLNEMDIADVIALGNAVSGLVNTVQTANRMIGEEFDASVKETAEAAGKEIRESRGAKPGFLQKWFAEEQLSPRRFLNMLGGWKNGTMAKLAKSLEDGQTRMLDFQRRAVQSFDPFMSKKENKEWLKTASGKNAKWSKYSVVNGMDLEGKSGYSGQEIEITPMMKIALYLHSLNDDNLRHIQTGGLVIPNKALYQKGKIAEAYAQGQKVKMQPEAVRAIASTLTAEEKTFAGYLQKFFNQQSKDAINEVSMQLDGFERAGVADYFPIETDSSFLKSDVAGEARSQTVEGIGSIANERVHAGNPIRLCDAYDVLTRQIDKVSRYYGYAIPIRNFQAVNNFVFHEDGNAYAGSIKDTMNRKWGSGAQQYITKMLADLQSGGSTKTDMLSRGLAWLRGNMAGATLSVNPSVAVSQVASYPGAAQAVGWDGLAAGLNLFHKVDEKLVEKYTPLLWYRSQGYSTQELGDAKAANNKTLGQKALNSKVLNWIQGMDRATVKRLWAAAEYRVTKDTGMKPGSKAQIEAGTDPYYKAVAEVFNRAVYDTQPNYTNMERAQILRSDSQLTKMLTMYKTVPLQYYGMMYEAMGRLQAAKNGTQAEQEAARKYAADTVSGLIAANTLYVAVKAAFKGLRRKDDDYRDEDGELTAGSVTKQLGKDLLETTAGSIIGGAEAYSIIDGWIHGKKFKAPEISALSHVEDVVNDVNNIFKAIDADDPRKTAGAVKTAAETLAMTWGIPVKNAETYLTALIGRAWPEAAMEYNNMFGGIDKSDLQGMDKEALGTGTNIIMRNRTGVELDRSATDELARLYGEGYREAVPTAIPDSFTYNGNTVTIKDRSAYSETWGAVVGDNLEELLSSDEYQAAEDKAKKGMIDRLYEYATVQARKQADPLYSAEGNSTYGWTVKADEAVEAGIPLSTTISAMSAINAISADKDDNGKSIAGSKKEKVAAYIDGLDLDDEQKDFMFTTVAGYGESSLEDAQWHDGSGIYTSTGSTSGTKISVPKGHEATYKKIVDDNLEALQGSAAYKAADPKGQKALVQKLQEYATVQAMKEADPDYSPAGTSHGWTVWADTAVKAGISLSDAIGHMTALGAMKADYDQYGKAITGSKKDKVCEYIDGLNLTDEQKDTLYLYVYAQNSLKYTPWHGYKKKTGKRGRRSSGGGRRRRTSSRTGGTVGTVRTGRKASSYIDASKLFGGGGSGKNRSGDASQALLEIIDKYYGGDAFAAAMDGGRKAKQGRTTIDFKL